MLTNFVSLKNIMTLGFVASIIALGKNVIFFPVASYSCVEAGEMKNAAKRMKNGNHAQVVKRGEKKFFARRIGHSDILGGRATGRWARALGSTVASGFMGVDTLLVRT